MAQPPRGMTGGQPTPAGEPTPDDVAVNTDQIYLFGVLAFSVAEARRILHVRPRKTNEVSTTKWAANFGLLIPDMRIDREYAITRADITEPVFVGMVEPVLRPTFHVVFDGCHRLFRALHEGRVSVPAYGFTTVETRQILAVGAAEIAARADSTDDRR